MDGLFHRLRRCWSDVLFPGEAVLRGLPHTPARPETTCPRPVWLLLLVSALLFFVSLGAPLLEPQEARYAELPRQMLASSSWLVPTLDGADYLDKPPLFYWCVMASYHLLGPHDWAARLVPGLAGVLVVLATCLWGQRVAGWRAGMCGAAVLVLMPEFVYRQRMLTFDALLCLWVTGALAAGHLALFRGVMRWRWWLVAGGLCGLGLLTKGPVALVLVAGPLLAFQFVDNRVARVGVAGWVGFLAVCVLVAGPWYGVVMVRRPGFAAYFFWKHNVERFASPFDHARPAWYYVPGLLLGMTPWTLLLPGFVRYLRQTRPRSAARRPAALGFFLLAGLLGLVFFSASGCKRPTYLLPVLPPLALALGCYLATLTRPGFQRPARQAGSLVAGVLLAGGTVALLAANRGMISPVCALVLCAAVGLALLGLVLRRGRVSWVTAGGIILGVLLAGVGMVLPGYNELFSVRTALLAVRRSAGADRVSVFCYPQHYDSARFYLPGAEVQTYPAGRKEQMLRDLEGRGAVVLVARSGALREVLAALPAGVEYRGPLCPGAVSVGLVQARRQAPPGLLANQGVEPSRR